MEPGPREWAGALPFDACAIFPNFRFWDLGGDRRNYPKIYWMLHA